MDRTAPSRTVVEPEGVTKQFDNSVSALRGVDLKVGAGERVAIMGPSGSGKWPARVASRMNVVASIGSE